MRLVALMLHAVEADGVGAQSPSFYSLRPAELESLLARLRSLDFQTITSEAYCRWRLGSTTASLPARSVLITFDDGTEDHFSVAAPLLGRFELVGTFFVTTGLVGRPGYLTWEQVRKLSSLGMEIGAHGVTHRPLTSLPDGELEAELTESRRVLEQELGITVGCMAAPGGYWDGRVAAAARRAGYEAAWTSRIGWNDSSTDPFGLRRVILHRPFSVGRAAKIASADRRTLLVLRGRQLAITSVAAVLGRERYGALKAALGGRRPGRTAR